MSRTAKLKKMLEGNPDDVFLNFGLAMELSQEGNHDEALALFDRVLEIDPNYSSAHVQKGQVLIGIGRLPEARTALQNGIDTAKAADDFHIADRMQTLLDGLPKENP